MAQQKTRMVIVKPAITVKFEDEVFKAFKRVARSKRTTPTELLRNLATLAIADHQHHQAAA